MFICPKISPFRVKLRYFDIIWKRPFLFLYTKILTFRKNSFFWDHFQKSFFAHISKNINNLRKITLFWDHIEKVFFWPYMDGSFKNSLLPYRRKYSHFKENFFGITLKKCSYVHEYKHFEKNFVILKSLQGEKSFFILF